MTNYNPTNNALSMMAASTGASMTQGGGGDEQSFYLAMAKAWGTSLDNEANKLIDLSKSISGGNDNPSNIALMSAQSLKFSYLSNAEHTSVESVGSALETMARKQ